MHTTRMRIGLTVILPVEAGLVCFLVTLRTSSYHYPCQYMRGNWWCSILWPDAIPKKGKGS